MELEQKTVKLNIIYNPFDLTDINKETLDWEEGITLGQYLSDLPTECDWGIAHNALTVDLEAHTDVLVTPGDTITLVVIPRGGGGFKNILRMIAMVAIAVAVPFLAPVIGAYAAAAVGAIAGILVNLLLAPKLPKAQKDDEQSYGFDGAKNTAKEGVALPVVYGLYRTGGNYCDLYTENVGDDQYLYGRTVLSDGEVHEISDPEFNDQSVTSFSNIIYGTTLGTTTESVNTYFGRAISQVNKSIKILNTSFLTHTTTTAVDGIQLNIQFPRGLVHITKKKGKKELKTRDIQVEYREVGTGSWLPFPQNAFNPITPVTGTSPSTSHIKVSVQSDNAAFAFKSEPSKFNIQYKLAADSVWKDLTGWSNYSSSTDAEIDDVDTDVNTTVNPVYTPKNNIQSYEAYLPTGQYQVRLEPGSDGSIVAFENGYVATGSGIISVSDRRVKTIRKTFEVTGIPYAFYEIRLKTTDADGDQEYDINEVYLTDVGEIETAAVPLNMVATGWYRAKMTEQFNSAPTVTWLVKGVKVNSYDINGNVTTNAWSDNPAWILADMLVSDLRGNGKPETLHWPSFVEWAEYCESEGLKFNGVIDNTENLYDHSQTVLKVGRANFSNFGTKIGVVCDKPALPQMLFGPGNIYEGTFGIDYLPLEGRANEYEVTYYDKNDKNKQKNIRITDPLAENLNLPPRPAQIDLRGVDNFTQAQKEAWYALYNNRYIRKTVSFDAPIEAIGIVRGDVALIQHDNVDWGFSGRLGAGSTNTDIILDKEIDMGAGVHSILVIHDTKLLFTSTVRSSNPSIKTYDLKNISVSVYTLTDAKRLIDSTGKDVEILSIVTLPYEVAHGYQARVILSDTITTTGTLSVYNTDVIEERDLVSNTNPTSTVTTTTPFTITPSQYSNWMIGPKTTVKRPFRLIAINGSGVEKRTLRFSEYNENIYNAPGYVVPEPVTNPTKYPEHVRNLFYSYALRATDVNTTVEGTVSWAAGHIIKYAGADIYVKSNDEDWKFVNTVMGVSEAQLNFTLKDNFDIKVVAFNDKMIRANINSAPTTSGTIASAPEFIDPPISLGANQISFYTAGLVELSWSIPTGYTAADGLRYRTQVKLFGDTEYDEYGVTTENFIRIGDLPVGNHSFRVRSERAHSYSTWVTIDYSTFRTSTSIEDGATNSQMFTTVNQPGWFNKPNSSATNGTLQSSDPLGVYNKPVTVGSEVRFIVPNLAGLSAYYIGITATPTDTLNFGTGFYGLYMKATPEIVDNSSTPGTTVSGLIAGETVRICNEASNITIKNEAGTVLHTFTGAGGTDKALKIRMTGTNASVHGVCIVNPQGFTAFNDIKLVTSSTATIQAPMPSEGDQWVGTDGSRIYSMYSGRWILRATVGAPNGTMVGGVTAEQVAATINDYNAVFDNVAPNPVTGLSLSSALTLDTDKTQQVFLTATWSASGASDLAGYTLAIQEDAGAFIEYNVGAGNTSFRWVVKANTLYNVKIKAYDRTSNNSAYSSVVAHTTLQDTVAPSAPTSVTGTAAFSNMFISWMNPAAADLDTIEIYENTTNNSGTAVRIATVKASPSKEGGYTRTIAGAAVTKYFWLKAVDRSGNSSGFSTGTGAITSSYVATTELSGTITNLQIADGAIDSITKFTTSISPVEKLAALPGSGNYQGRVVMLTTDNKIYRYTGTVWTKEADGADITANSITAGRFAVGAIQAADIAANQITAGKLFVGDVQNYVVDTMYDDSSYWVYQTTQGQVWGYTDTDVTSLLNTTKGCKTAVGNGTTSQSTSYTALHSANNRFSVIPGKKYYVSMEVLVKAGFTGQVRAVVYPYDQAGTQLSILSINGTDYRTTPCATDTVEKITGQVTLASNTTKAGVAIGYTAWSTTQNNAGYAIVGKVVCKQAAEGELIVDGTITGAKVQAGTITGSLIAADTIVTSKLIVGDMTNMVRDYNMIDTGAWLAASGDTSTYTLVSNTSTLVSSKNYLQIAAASSGLQQIRSLPYEVVQGKPYYFSVATQLSSNGNGTATVSVEWYSDATATTLISSQILRTSTSSTLGKTSGLKDTSNVDVIAPTGAKRAVILLSRTTAGTNAANARFTDIIFKRATNGELVIDGSIVTNHMTANSINGDRISAASIYANKLFVSGNATQDALPTGITVGVSGTTIGVVDSRSADPIARGNTLTTTLLPGLVQISGATTLADWRQGGDTTKIAGGSISANTISSNKVEVGLRGLDITGLQFTANWNGSVYTANRCHWSAGTITYVNDAGTATSVSITTSSVLWTTGVRWIYWVKDATTLSTTTSAATAYGANNVVLGTYAGDTDMVINYGRTVVDGSNITTGTINADRINGRQITANQVVLSSLTGDLLAATSIITNTAQINNGIISTANIGNLQVTNATIANLTVGTTKIEDLAVNKIYYFNTSSDVTAQPVDNVTPIGSQVITKDQPGSGSNTSTIKLGLNIRFASSNNVIGDVEVWYGTGTTPGSYGSGTKISSDYVRVKGAGSGDTKFNHAMVKFHDGLSAGDYWYYVYFIKREEANTTLIRANTVFEATEVKK